MIFSQIEHDRTSREVERQIENLILEGVLRVGDKLPGERELSKSLNVSRPILRQALAHLTEKGLLIAQHGGGTYVADVIGTVFAPPVVTLIGSNAKAKADYLEYRREIEGMTAALAAKRITDADKAVLQRIMEDMQSAHNDQRADRETEIDVEFHNAVGECAHNIVLLHTLRSCYRLLSDDVFLNRELIYKSDGAREKLLEQHQAIHAAVVGGIADAAAKAAQDHITFIIEATSDAERHDDRQSVSQLRLVQHHERHDAKRNKSVRKSTTDH